MLPVACGLALAAQLRGDRRVAAAFTGDGATSEGDFHEALNLAAVWKLPVVFVIENNHWGLSTPAHEQYACKHLADRGIGYGMPGIVVDGNDLLAVHRAVRRAADRARRGEGPTLLEFKTFRMRGHEEASGTDYVPKEQIEEWAKKDPVRRYEAFLVQNGLFTESEFGTIRVAYKARIDALVDEALEAPEPRSTVEEKLADVFAPSLLVPRPPSPEAEAEAPELRYVDAISDGLRTAMRRDDRVVLLGQDIAEYGGVFKVTEGFVEEFGKARVRNTPIIESGAIGCALGLALGGHVPMVEMQFGDFITCGFNQIVNNLAKTHWRWGGRVPVVIRAPVGGGTGAGPFHSQCVESWFTARRRDQGRGAGDALRRQGPAARGLRGRQPRPLPRAQAPLPLREGPGAGGALLDPARPGPRRARGRGRHRGHLRRGSRLGPRGRRGARGARAASSR